MKPRQYFNREGDNSATSDVTDHTRQRGQSEVVGSLLLAGLLIVTLSTVGGLAILNVTDRMADETPLVDCDIGTEDGDVIVTHAGGESLDVDGLETIHRNESSERQDVARVQGDADGRFEPGETIHSGSVSNETDVVLVTPDSVVCRETVRPDSDDDDDDDE